MIQILKRIIMWPLQYVAQSLIKSAQYQLSKDINLELQRQCLFTTTEYVRNKMYNCTVVTSPREILDCAIKSISIKNGAILEFGVFRGRSISHIASRVGNVVHGFDSFEGLPEYWRPGYQKGMFKVNAMPRVPANVQLHKGWFSETLPEYVKSHAVPISLLHVDCDLYSSTVTIFEHLHEYLLSGSVIVFDEYFNYPRWEQGEYKAFQEFCDKHKRKYRYIAYNTYHEQVVLMME